MKFYRMDSDRPQWNVWSQVYAEFGKRDFHFAKAVYDDLYGLLAEKIEKKMDGHAIEVNLRVLRDSVRCSMKRLIRCLPRLAEIFEFEIDFVFHGPEKSPTKVRLKSDESPTKVRLKSDESPTSILVFYPKLLEKQRISKPWINTIYGFKTKTKTKTKNTGEKETFSRGEVSEAQEILALIIDQRGDLGRGIKRPSRDAVHGLAKDLLVEFGIEVIRKMKDVAKATGEFGLVTWDPKQIRRVAVDICEGKFNDLLMQQGFPQKETPYP